MTRKKAIEMAEIWNKDLNDGDSIEGFYTKKEVAKTRFGESEKYIIETKDGEKKSIFSSASLVRQFANIPTGCYVWVTYKGKEQSKNGQMVKVFEVEYDDEVRK